MPDKKLTAMSKTFMLTSLTFLAINACFSQIAGRKSKESINIFDSIPVNAGDTVHLGSGTDRRGDFVYIYQPPNVLMGVQEQALERRYAGKYAIIKFFKVQHDRRTGDKTVAVINPFGGLNFICDLEAAIDAKEVTAINGRSFVKSAQPTVVVQQAPQSVADELAKLKKLYDDSVLTKEEYEAQKKKLLDKQ